MLLQVYNITCTILTSSFRICETVALVFPPLMNIADFVFSVILASLWSKNLFPF